MLLRSGITIVGWLLFAFLAFRVSNSTFDVKVYNPFEILGLRSVRAQLSFTFQLPLMYYAQSATEKEIKSHFKKLSKQ